MSLRVKLHLENLFIIISSKTSLMQTMHAMPARACQAAAVLTPLA